MPATTRPHDDPKAGRSRPASGTAASIPRGRVLRSAGDRSSTLMFSVAGHAPAAVAAALAEREIAVWQGNYYAFELSDHLGLEPEGAVRPGFVHYNDASEAERLLDAVGELASAAAA